MSLTLSVAYRNSDHMMHHFSVPGYNLLKLYNTRPSVDLKMPFNVRGLIDWSQFKLSNHKPLPKYVPEKRWL